MRVKKFHIKFLLITAVLLLPLLVWSQSKTDSILAVATQQIYENPDTAIEMAKKLLEEPKVSTENRVRIILLISTAYSSKRDYEKSLEYALSAMDFLPKLKDNNLKIDLFNKIGGQYQNLKIYEKAIVYLDKALELIKKLPDDEDKSRNLGINNLLRGFVYRAQMSCDIALNYFEKGIEDFKKTLDSAGGNSNISISYYNQGNCLLALERIDEAENSFLQSINYAKKADAISLIAFAQKGLAQVYTTQKQYNKAIEMLTEALKNSEDVGDKVLNRALYDALATNYLATGDFKNYSVYRNKNIAIHKQLTKVERKTVDDAINDLMATNSEKIETVKNRTNVFQLIIISLIFLCLIFTIRTLIISGRKLKSLKKRLKY
jgi:tetratricopeptide (TPR) repeat protein